MLRHVEARSDLEELHLLNSRRLFSPAAITPFWIALYTSL